jgi:hypothetical protein
MATRRLRDDKSMVTGPSQLPFTKGQSIENLRIISSRIKIKGKSVFSSSFTKLKQILLNSVE